VNSILENLNRCVGIKGSMVVTPDGVVVASQLGAGLEEDRVAAIASVLIPGIRRALERAQLGPFSRCMLTATDGKLVIVDAGIAFLVVATDSTIRLDVTMLEIDAAARRIERKGQLAQRVPVMRSEG